MSEAVEMCHRGEGPVLIVTETFRMGGHATHDEREARELFDQAQYDYWGARDPIGMYETFLMEDHGVSETRLTAIESEVIEVLDDAARKAVSKLETHQPDPSTVSDGVYRDGPV